MNAALKSIMPMASYNPLDDFEDLLESSAYDYDRATKTRLHFNTRGRQGDYGLMLEWNEDARIIRCSLVITATQSIPRDVLETCVLQANESAWHGFFVLDGVGNSIFKSLIQYLGKNEDQTMMMIEDAIDAAVSEADRYSISLALSDNEQSPGLFGQDEEFTLDNLTLMFADMKGSA